MIMLMVTLRIKVTQEDIDKGCAEAATCCPIARAIGRRIPDGRVAVLGRSGSIDHEAILLMPVSCLNFVKHFDSGRNVEPFEFDLVIQ